MHPTHPLLIVPKKPVLVSIPFISHKCNSDIKKELRRICAEVYPQINLKLIFSNNFSIESMLMFKDQTPVDLLRNIVHIFNCSQCEASYVGETTRHLHTRVADHKSVSFRTHRPPPQPLNSGIRDHDKETNLEMVFNDFRVLSRYNKFDTKITESVLIHQMRPSLNKQEASAPLNILR